MKLSILIQTVFMSAVFMISSTAATYAQDQQTGSDETVEVQDIQEQVLDFGSLNSLTLKKPSSRIALFEQKTFDYSKSLWFNSSFTTSSADLRRLPVERSATFVPVSSTHGLGNIGSQHFSSYKIGKTRFLQINSFDWSGNLTNSSFQIQL
ncbi:MAG: hypothetical protein AAGJ93_02660 [Bacteroidota bacterium]